MCLQHKTCYILTIKNMYQNKTFINHPSKYVCLSKILFIFEEKNVLLLFISDILLSILDRKRQWILSVKGHQIKQQ